MENFKERKFTKIEQDIIDNINKEVKEFNVLSDGTREQKREVMKKRRVVNLKEKKSFLQNTYRKHFKKFYDIGKVDFGNLEPELILCTNQDQKDMWTFFRMTQSSLVWSGYYGRSMTYLLRDKNSGCVMGVLGLGSDFMAFKSRDDYIGWTRKDKFGKTVHADTGKEYTGKSVGSWKKQKELGLKKVDNRINNLMNIFVCVGVEPFNRLLVGKLLAMIAYSRQVMSDFEKKYNQPLVGITTTSIYGKSIQYDRIGNYMKYLGLSKGIGTAQFSVELVEKIRKYYDGDFKVNNRKDWMDTGHLGLQPKAKMIQMIAKHLGLKSSILRHGHRRGIYFGYTCRNSQLFLQGKIKELSLKPIENRSSDDIINFWKERWMTKRIPSRVNKIEENRYEFIEDYKSLMSLIRNGDSQKTLWDLK